jgi:hypothetical protein
MSYNSFSNNNTGPNQYALLQFRKTNSFTTVLTGDTLARIEFSGYNATADFLLGASIGCRVTGVPNLNIPSELLFYTSTGLATVVAMVIGQNGNVEITPLSGVGLTVSGGEIISTGNLNFAATAQRITGDMSNATHANRLAFQSSTVNGNTSLFVLPNGTGVSSSVLASNAGDPTNSGFAQIQIDNTSVKLISSVLGTGVQLPMEIRIGSTAAIDINTSRAVSIANTSAGVPLTITGTTSGGLTVNQSNSAAANISLVQSSATAEPPYVNFFKSRSGGNINAADGLGNIRFFGFATANQVAAQITCSAESIGAARVSGGLNFWTTNTAGSTGQRLILVADGGLSINTPSTAISALTVNGFNTAGTYAQQNNAVTPGALFSAFRALNNTATAGSSCQIECSVSGQVAATGGDAYLRFVNYGVNLVNLGLDTSVNQFSMSTGTLGDANTFFTYDVATTQINKPRQCAWSYYAAQQLNVTGGAAGNAYTVLFANINYNIATTVNGTFSTFTVPKTGKYLLSANVRIDNLIAGMTTGYLSILSGATTIALFALCNPFACSSAGAYIFGGSTMVALNTGSVLSVVITVIGLGTNDADILASISTNFSGQLLS